MIKFILEFMLLGLIGGLFGIFYRYSLKSQGAVFSPLYYKWLKPWAEGCEDIIDAGFNPKLGDKVKAYVARFLGYCMYSSTLFITIIICVLYLSSWEDLSSSSSITIGIMSAISMQHLVVVISYKWLIHKPYNSSLI